MNARVVGVLVVLLVVLGGAALLAMREDRAQRPQNAATLGQPLLKDLKAADIARIRIVEPKSTLTLERKEDGWVIAEREGFPADLAKVRDFVVKMVGLKIAQSEPIGEKDRARLNLDASTATQVEFAGADGKPLAKLLVGRKIFRSEPENPDRAPGDGRFVLLPGDDKNALMVPDPLTQATTRTSEWIDKRSFQIEKVKTLEVRYPDGESWRLERSGDNAPWKMSGLKPGEQVDTSKANAATYSLGLLDLADVAPKDASPQATGLDKPIELRATTLAGLAYDVKVGKLEGENYYVKLDSGSAERDKLLEQHVLLIAKSRLEDTLKKRAELVEKKDTKK
jgi:Domain of unknown function (DUF4340)